MFFSIIIPVYNRPQEVGELLESLASVRGHDLEVIVVEDGSTVGCRDVVERYADRLAVSYYFKENTGPGLTRNYGAERAGGRYLVFFDSDCIVPWGYFDAVTASLSRTVADGWGGPDRAHYSFTVIQKAINYAMTSFLTTGGIRGRKGGKSLDKFYARSFNMGMRREVFEALGGFSPMRVGEDIDLSTRLMAAGYTSVLFPDAWVYHKRRTGLGKFFRQVHSFGRARPALGRLHPGTTKAVHFLPALFTVGLALLLILSIWFPYLLLLPALYFVAVAVDSAVRNRSLVVGLVSVPAAIVQLTGYGTGFIRGMLKS